MQPNTSHFCQSKIVGVTGKPYPSSTAHGCGCIWTGGSVIDNPKTDSQRNAIHVWFDLVAKVLNDNGIDKRVVLHKLKTRGLDTQWTAASFKEDV